MDSAQLRTFLAAASTGSFASAALVVHASSSSITDRIAVLEREMGARLFERTRKGCTLTAEGQRFLPAAQALLATWDMARAEARMASSFEGLLRIGAQYALWPDLLTPRLQAVREAFPKLGLSLSAASPRRLDRELASGLLDIAVLYNPLFGSGYRGREIAEDTLVFVASRDCADWRDAVVQIDWGEGAERVLAEALGGLEVQGLRLDLGGMAVRWLVDNRAAGYVPLRLATGAIESGALQVVDSLPSIPFPIFAMWRQAAGKPLPDDIAAVLGHLEAPD